MRFRKLRIAWSVGCGIVCVLLIVLWVRSYQPSTEYRGRFQSHRNGGFGISSVDGRFGIYAWDIRPNRWDYLTDNWRSAYGQRSEPYGILGFAISRSWARGLLLPYWFLILFVASIGWLSWFRWRFTTRTLLIATTLVAVVLGLVVWARRN